MTSSDIHEELLRPFPQKEVETDTCGTVLSPHFIHSSANE